MMINFYVAFILTGIIIVVKGDLFVPNHFQLFGIAWNGIFTMAIPNTTWILALEGRNTAKISNLAYITPFLSMIWTSLILKEILNFYYIIGLLVIVAGIFSSMAICLLETIERDHIVGEENQMLSCCGHTMIATDNFENVVILGCNSGIDWSVIYEDYVVKFVTETGKETKVPIDEYKKTVFRFADKVELLL